MGGSSQMSTDLYSSPLSERYASKEMQFIFSQDMKFRTWRRLWIALAETEMGAKGWNEALIDVANKGTHPRFLSQRLRFQPADISDLAMGREIPASPCCDHPLYRCTHT